MIQNLYDVDLTGVPATTPCSGNDGVEGESCVVSREIPGVPGALAISDSKNSDAGELRFTADELTSFAREVLD
jgi:hypothetical protein